VVNVSAPGLSQQSYQRRSYTDSFTMSGNTGKTSNSGLAQPPSLASGEDFRINANVDPASIPQHLRKNCILFYTGEMEELAKRVAQHAGGSIELGKIRWR
jgi:hypothetical protein